MSEQLTVESCWAALKNVIDPELYQNIVDLGLVYGVEVTPENDANVTMTLTTPHCPMGPQIIENVDKYLHAAGARNVNIQIVWSPMWTPAMMADHLKRMMGIETEEEALDDEPEPAWTPPPAANKKKGFLSRLFG